MNQQLAQAIQEGLKEREGEIDARIAGMAEWEAKLEKLANEESENLVKSFQQVFEECTAKVKKPNILVAGITGAGKSTLINAVFGAELARAGAGLPVTQHFQKFEPEDKPVRIYDSKGLEWSAHEEFIQQTGKFFVELRQKPDVADHIHVVWYVVNTARGRFEPFEATLVRDVFNPTPVIFILNKTDMADSKQIKAIKAVIEDEKLPNNRGIHVVISQRETWTQQWCPECLSNDVFYDEEFKQLECAECGFTDVLQVSYNLPKIVSHTVELLPDLAKDAFTFAQNASLTEKDDRAKEVVKNVTKHISLDAKGNFIAKMAEMCARLFVIWGWPLTADTFREGLSAMQKDYLQQLKFSERVAASTLDKMFGSKLSRGFTGLIGISMNRGMKRLYGNLIEYCKRGELDKMKTDDFMDESDFSEDIMQLYFTCAFKEGADAAIDKFWDMSPEEIAEMASLLSLSDDRNMVFVPERGDMLEGLSLSEVDIPKDAGKEGEPTEEEQEEEEEQGDDDTKPILKPSEQDLD